MKLSKIQLYKEFCEYKNEQHKNRIIKSDIRPSANQFDNKVFYSFFFTNGIILKKLPFWFNYRDRCHCNHTSTCSPNCTPHRTQCSELQQTQCRHGLS